MANLDVPEDGAGPGGTRFIFSIKDPQGVVKNGDDEASAVDDQCPLSQLIYKKLKGSLTPTLSSSFGTIISSATSPSGDVSEDKKTLTRPEAGVTARSEDNRNAAGTSDDEPDVATPVTDKSQRSLLNTLGSLAFYADVQQLVHGRISRSDKHAKKGRAGQLVGYMLAASSDESEQEDGDANDADDIEEPTDTEDQFDADFKDALDTPLQEQAESLSGFMLHSDGENSIGEAQAMTANASTLTENSHDDFYNSVDGFDSPTKAEFPSQMTPFQSSIVKNLSVFLAGNVLTNMKDEGLNMDEERLAKLKLKVAERLQRVFSLSDNDLFITNVNIWLVRDVLLQGHIYLTKDCLFFFAFLPQKYACKGSGTEGDEEEIIQTGALAMKTKKYGELLSNVLTTRFWAILRPETLTLYSSPTDLYFPSRVIDLRTCTHVEILEKYHPKTEFSSSAKPTGSFDSAGAVSPRDMSIGKTDYFDVDEDELRKVFQQEAEENKENTSSSVWFKIVTKKKSYKIACDNMYVARQWVNNITKIIFQMNNANSKNEVLIKIPLENVVYYNRRNLFAENSDEDANVPDRNVPAAFVICYTNGTKETSNTPRAKKMAQKFKTKIPGNGNSSLDPDDPLSEVEDLYFVTNVGDFYNRFDNVMKERQTDSSGPAGQFSPATDYNIRLGGFTLDEIRKRTMEISVTSKKEAFSTLSPSASARAIVNEVCYASSLPQFIFEDKTTTPLERQDSDSTFKKLGKTLKLFGSRSRDNSKSSGVASPRENNDAIWSSQSVSPVNLSLPRQLSFTGLKNLNMSFEAYKRNPEAYEDIYSADDRRKSLANTQANEDYSTAGPLALSDPSEYEVKSEKKSKPFGRSLKAISGMTSLWNAQPNHWSEGITEGTDQYFVKEESTRELAIKHFRGHFSLPLDAQLSATYYCHVVRSFPIYGKLYIGKDVLCFRSLLPGVSTKMIVPIRHIDNCFSDKGSTITYHGLNIFVRGRDELVLEFSSQRARDDCLKVILEMLDQHHANETWEPQAHEWGRNYDLELGRKRLTAGANLEEFALAQSIQLKKKSKLKIEKARLKLFEDKFMSASGLQVPIILEDSPFVKTEVRPSTSYNFVLLTIGSRGDVQPYIALAKGLKEEGHNVTIATHTEFQEWIESHKIGFKPIAGDPTELMSLMVTHGSLSLAFIKEANAKFKGWINDLLRTSWEACQGADILIESPSSMGGIHVAEALCIPYMRAFTMPWTRTRAYPHAFIVPEQSRGGSYNFLTHIMFEAVFWRGVAGQVNKWRVETLGLPKTNLYKLQQSKVPFLYNVSPTIFPPAVDFPDWVKVNGYWFLDEGQGANYKPDKKLVQFMEQATVDRKKIVYIGFGSIVVSDAKSLTKAIVEAVLDAGVRCILNKGWSDRLSEKENAEAKKTEPEIELPPEVFNTSAVPHDWLFPRIDAAVHHGGSGTTGATLRSGIPMIIKPFFGDQFFYAARVEDIGVGLSLKKLNTRSLSKALQTVTTDLKIIDKSKKVSCMIRREDGVSNAIEAIYDEMEYARSLMVGKKLASDSSRAAHELRSGSQTPATAQTYDLDSVASSDDFLEDESTLSRAA